MTKHTRRARCHITAFDELECTIPFHRGLVEEWKDAIPFRSRSYDPDSKAWRFWSGYQELAMALLVKHMPDAELPSRARSHAKSQTRHAGSDHFQVLYLLPSAPPELIDAAFRCLAKIHHPDVGGDPATMRRLTEARDALTRRLSA
jgi:hypothetical protein